MTSTHSKQSNYISRIESGCQNWCILRKNHKYEKFSFFSEVYDGNIFEIPELKTELLELPKPQGLARKFKKFMFFEAARLNIHQNAGFKLWLQVNNSCAHFLIPERSSKRSSYGSEAKNTSKIYVKFELYMSQSIQNWHPGAPFWAPFFWILKSMKCQHSLEQKINVIAHFENFLVSFENRICK